MLDIKNDASLLDKCNVLTLCTMFNTKPEHGDIYINCKNLIYLLTNFYIFSTPPLSVLDFPRTYFPFTTSSSSPVLFIATSLFDSKSNLINPDNKTATDLKITCLIITILYIFLLKGPRRDVNDKISITYTNSNILIEHLYGMYRHKNFPDVKSFFSNYISNVDLDDLSHYMTSIFLKYNNFEAILSEYKKIYGVDYDFFRKL